MTVERESTEFLIGPLGARSSPMTTLEELKRFLYSLRSRFLRYRKRPTLRDQPSIEYNLRISQLRASRR